MGLPAGRVAFDPGDRRWREVLDLGAALISAWLRPAQAKPGDTPVDEISQRRTILETTERLIGGKAALWMLPAYDPGGSDSPPGAFINRSPSIAFRIHWVGTANAPGRESLPPGS